MTGTEQKQIITPGSHGLFKEALLTFPHGFERIDITLAVPGTIKPRYEEHDDELYLRTCRELRVAPYSQIDLAWDYDQKRFFPKEASPFSRKTEEGLRALRQGARIGRFHFEFTSDDAYTSLEGTLPDYEKDGYALKSGSIILSTVHRGGCYGGYEPDARIDFDANEGLIHPGGLELNLGTLRETPVTKLTDWFEKLQVKYKKN